MVGPNDHEASTSAVSLTSAFVRTIVRPSISARQSHQPPVPAGCPGAPPPCDLLVAGLPKHVFERLAREALRIGLPGARQRPATLRARRPGAGPSLRRSLGGPRPLKNDLVSIAEQRPRTDRRVRVVRQRLCGPFPSILSRPERRDPAPLDHGAWLVA